MGGEGTKTQKVVKTGGSSAPAGKVGGPTATGWPHLGSENTFGETVQEYRQKIEVHGNSVSPLRRP